MDLTLLPRDLRAGASSEAEVFENIAEKLRSDPELWAAITVALTDQPQPDDLYPTLAHPPAAWYEPQTVPKDLKAAVLPGGQVMGRFFQWGECVIGQSTPGNCWTPTSSPTGYQDFHQSDQAVTMADGSVKMVQAGLLVPGHSHPGSSVQASIAHYNDPTLGRCSVRCYEDEHGGYFVGSMIHGSTYADVATVRASATSGHWTYRENAPLPNGNRFNGYDCLGPCLVARPGAPLVRPQPTAQFAAVTASAGARPDVYLENFPMSGPDCSCNDKPEVTAALTMDATRDRLRAVLRDSYEGDDTYVYVRDFTTTEVFFEVDGDDTPQGTIGQAYSIGPDDQVSLTGEPYGVSIQYVADGADSGPIAEANSNPVAVQASAADADVSLGDVMNKLESLSETVGLIDTRTGAVEAHIAEQIAAEITPEDIVAVREEMSGDAE